MSIQPTEALLDAAEAGVAFDGLRVEVDDGSYVFEVPAASYRGLERSEAKDAMSRHRAHVNEWYFWETLAPESPDRWAFLRWLERADERGLEERREALGAGETHEWGQLSIRIKLAKAGRRTYSVRHVADVDERVDELDVYTDPLDARNIRRFDADGDYRPLSTAPTLRPGWAMVDLDATELPRAVEYFYPATIANWHRESRNELDVSHWDATAERQTGMYSVIDDLGSEAVRALATSCCLDSECLKRRQWDESEGDEGELGVARGEGSFPCREACSLVIAAAREWARTEEEDCQTYELELSPSEKDQLERLIDAVADGEMDDVGAGEVNDPANHLRVRYLRARWFDDGELPVRAVERAGDEHGE